MLTLIVHLTLIVVAQFHVKKTENYLKGNGYIDQINSASSVARGKKMLFIQRVLRGHPPAAVTVW